MTLEAGIYIYLGGVLFWSFFLGCFGSKIDWGFLASIIIWPICACSFAGQLFRKAFK